MSTGWKSRLTPLGAGSLQEDEFEIGSIAGVFGVRGEVRLHLHNRESTLLEGGRQVVLLIDGERFSVRVRSRPGAGRRILARLDHIDDRSDAEALMGATLAMVREVLPKPEPGEYYLEEVVGMQVRCGGESLGTIVQVHTTGPVEVFELDGQRYLPSTAENLLEIDRRARIVYVAAGALAV